MLEVFHTCEDPAPCSPTGIPFGSTLPLLFLLLDAANSMGLDLGGSSPAHSPAVPSRYLAGLSILAGSPSGSLLWEGMGMAEEPAAPGASWRTRLALGAWNFLSPVVRGERESQFGREGSQLGGERSSWAQTGTFGRFPVTWEWAGPAFPHPGATWRDKE